MSSNGTNNPSSNASASQEQSDANKRAALAGQWRTPPLPVFPTGGFSQQKQQAGQPPPQHSHHAPPQPQPPMQQHVAQAPPPQPTAADGSLPSLPAPTSIPVNSEDYAKALQEAYRKGAEAAAMMAHQHPPPPHQTMPTAASCPNFATGPPPAPSSQPPPPTVSGVIAEEAAYATSTAGHHQHPPQSHPPHMTSQSPAIPDSLGSSMPPPPTVPPPHAAPPTQPPPPQHHHQAPPPQAQPHEYSPPPPSGKGQGRSLSLPDMSAYAAQAEEEKRQKRLARNRASARLRRLRKKNLVDAYETEVGILEKTLKQLQAHEWGQDDDHKALLDALGMERGQQAIPPDQRTSIIKDILTQQMQQLQLLRQSQQEQECLTLLAEAGDDDQDELTKELQDLLQLTDTQKQELLGASKGIDKEVEALDTVMDSLQAMQENEWLLNKGVQGITDQFTSILHKNQLSKFLLWTDANVEAIDQLDHVQVQPLQTAPIFTFGVETTPGDDEEK